MRISDWSSDVCSSDLMYCLLTLTVILISADSSGFGLGHSVFMAGLALVPYSLASVAGSRWAHRVRGRLGPRALLPTGCGMFLSATATLAAFHDHLWQGFVAMGIGGIGSGFTFSSLAVLMVPHLPAADRKSTRLNSSH